jgi:ribosome-associated translation inhibitor RaiA
MVDRVMEDLPIEVATAGEVTVADRQLAVERIAKVLHLVDSPILHIDLRLELSPDPAREHPAHARATLDLNGERVRAHVSAAAMPEAIDLLEQRLRRRLEQLAEHRRALRRRGTTSPAGEWRHGDLPAERPPWFDRPVAERDIVQHKSFATPAATIDEAIFDLESMDYDFFLFTEIATGRDGLVHRRHDGGYGLRSATARTSR